MLLAGCGGSQPTADPTSETSATAPVSPEPTAPATVGVDECEEAGQQTLDALAATFDRIEGDPGGALEAQEQFGEVFEDLGRVAGQSCTEAQISELMSQLAVMAGQRQASGGMNVAAAAEGLLTALCDAGYELSPAAQTTCAGR